MSLLADGTIIIKKISLLLIILIAFQLLFLVTEAHEENCTDFEGGTVTHGLLYVPGPSVCSMCVCYHSEPMWCQAIYCAPPYKCKRFRIGERCCDFTCLDGDAEWYGPDTVPSAATRLNEFMENILSATILVALRFFY